MKCKGLLFSVALVLSFVAFTITASADATLFLPDASRAPSSVDGLYVVIPAGSTDTVELALNGTNNKLFIYPNGEQISPIFVLNSRSTDSGSGNSPTFVSRDPFTVRVTANGSTTNYSGRSQTAGEYAWYGIQLGVYYLVDYSRTQFPDTPALIDYLIANDRTGESTFQLPCGNVAFVRMEGSIYGLRLSADFGELAGFNGRWNYNTISYAANVQLPTVGNTFDSDNLTPVIFENTGGKKNLFGVGTYGTATLRGAGWICLYNPTYQQYSQGGKYVLNPTITCTGKIVDLVVYPLSGGIVTGEGIVSYSESDYSHLYAGTIDTETGTVSFFNERGEPENPVTGGTGALPADLAPDGNIIDLLKHWLQEIVGAINNLFNTAVGAISNLINSGRAFMSSLAGLYSWLPSSVYTVLASACILVITIGVIKILL